MSWEIKEISKLSLSIKDKGNAGDINYIEIGDIDTNTKNYIIKEKLSVENPIKAKKGDIIISKVRPTRRAVSIIKENEILVSNAFIVLRANSNVDINYLFYCIAYNDDLFSHLEKVQKGSSYPSCRESDVINFKIALPPLTTQKRIAEILDAADVLRRKDQELLKKYDELAQAIFVDMFGDPVKNDKGWNISALEELCTDIVDCPHSTPNHTQEITDFPCIRTSEMKNGKISWGSMKYLNKEDYSIRVKRLVPEAGDIVYAREGTYGEAVLLPKNYHFALGQRTMLLRPNSNLVSNEFLWFQINSDYVYHQAKRKNMGSTVGHVNVADVKKFAAIQTVGSIIYQGQKL